MVHVSSEIKCGTDVMPLWHDQTTSFKNFIVHEYYDYLNFKALSFIRHS